MTAPINMLLFKLLLMCKEMYDSGKSKFIYIDFNLDDSSNFEHSIYRLRFYIKIKNDNDFLIFRFMRYLYVNDLLYNAVADRIMDFKKQGGMLPWYTIGVDLIFGNNPLNIPNISDSDLLRKYLFANIVKIISTAEIKYIPVFIPYEYHNLLFLEKLNDYAMSIYNESKKGLLNIQWTCIQGSSTDALYNQGYMVLDAYINALSETIDYINNQILK